MLFEALAAQEIVAAVSARANDVATVVFGIAAHGGEIVGRTLDAMIYRGRMQAQIV